MNPIYRKPLRAINFICHSTQAKSVSVVGDFNHWDPAAHPMKQMPDRSWLLMVELNHGHHRYAFLVDGVLTLDSHAQGVTCNDKGERVSLVPVS
jgi:1,4-alpha-glucan branching enzyme